MQILDFTLAVNTSRPIEAPGTYFYYYSGSAGGADSTIILKEDSRGSTVILKPGQAFRLPAGSGQAVRWYVSNYANTATIVGSVVIGDGEITDNRVTGSVEVVNGEKARTLAGGMFAGSAFCAAVAATYSTIQLWNPPASGKRLIVTNVSYGVSGAAGTIAMLMKAATLANLFAVSPANKMPGSPAPVALLKYENTAASETFPLGKLRNEDLAANTPRDWNIGGALVVPPGYGLNSYGAAVNTTTLTSFEWFEESNN